MLSVVNTEKTIGNGDRGETKWKSNLKGVKSYIVGHDGELGLVQGLKVWLQVSEMDRESTRGNLEVVNELVELMNLAKTGSEGQVFLAKLAAREIEVTSNKMDGWSMGMVENLKNIEDKGGKEEKRKIRSIFAKKRGEISEIAADCLEREGPSAIEAWVELGFLEIEGMNRAERRNRIDEIICVFGLNKKMTNDFINSWMSFDYEVMSKGSGAEGAKLMFKKMVDNNLLCLQRLVKDVGKEGIEKLYQEYGITNFGRYPAEVLIKQLTNEDKDIPYGIALGAFADHNGALQQDYDFFNQLTREAEDLGFGLRIIEARDKLSVVRRLMWLDKKFGLKNKIGYGVICAHGNSDSVILGVGENDTMSISDLDKKSAKALLSVYGKNAPFLFNSCLTGWINGLTTAYSRYNGGVSVGADTEITGMSVRMERSLQGFLYFNGHFGSNGENTETMIYKNGVDWRKGEKVDSDKRVEQIYQNTIHDKKFMDDLWNNRIDYGSSILGTILGREILVPLYEKMCTKSWGKEISFGIGVRNISSGELLVSPNDMEGGYMKERRRKDDCVVFSPSFDEGFVCLAKYVYVHLAGRENLQVFVKMMIAGKVEEIPLDLTRLYPENIP